MEAIIDTSSDQTLTSLQTPFSLSQSQPTSASPHRQSAPTGIGDVHVAPARSHSAARAAPHSATRTAAHSASHSARHSAAHAARRGLLGAGACGTRGTLSEDDEWLLEPARTAKEASISAEQSHRLAGGATLLMSGIRAGGINITGCVNHNRSRHLRHAAEHCR